MFSFGTMYTYLREGRQISQTERLYAGRKFPGAFG